MAIVIQHQAGGGAPGGGMTPEWEALYQQDAARKDAMARSIGASIANVGQVIREDARYRQQSVAAAQQQQFENQMAIERAQVQQQQFEADLGLRQQAGERADYDLALRDRAQQFAEQKYGENIVLDRLVQYEQLTDAMPDDMRAGYIADIGALRNVLTRPMTEYGRTNARDAILARLDEKAAHARKKKTMQERVNEGGIYIDELTGERYSVKTLPDGTITPDKRLEGRDSPTHKMTDNAMAAGRDFAKMMIPDPETLELRPPNIKEIRAYMREFAMEEWELRKMFVSLETQDRIDRRALIEGGTGEPAPQPPAPQPAEQPRLTPALGRDIRQQVVEAFGGRNLTDVPLDERKRMVDAAISQRENAQAPSLRKPVSQWEPKDIDEEIEKQGPQAERFRVEVAQMDAELSGRVARAVADQQAGRITVQELVAIRQAAQQQAEAFRRDLLERLNAPPPEEKWDNMRRWAESTNPTTSMHY